MLISSSDNVFLMQRCEDCVRSGGCGYKGASDVDVRADAPDVHWFSSS
jgi:hypothetical protein